MSLPAQANALMCAFEAARVRFHRDHRAPDSPFWTCPPGFPYQALAIVCKRRFL